MQFDRSTPWGRIVLAWRRRGAIGSIGRVFRIIQDRLFDLRYGIDTCNHARLVSLTIESVNARAGFEYEPTRLCTFRKVMSALHPPPGSVLVDFGCGKGRVLLLAAHYGFERVVGVEFARELCVISRENIRRYRKRTNIEVEIEIFEGDVVDYRFRDDENVFYFFDPFHEGVMRRVVQEIVRSLERVPRQAFLIYVNLHDSQVLRQYGFAPYLGIESEVVTVFTRDHLDPHQ